MRILAFGCNAFTLLRTPENSKKFEEAMDLGFPMEEITRSMVGKLRKFAYVTQKWKEEETFRELLSHHRD